jgi:hypothetical protein
MKRVLVILFLILALNIYADFSEIIELDNGAAISYSQDQAMASEGEYIYFAFWSNEMIKLAVSDNSGSSFSYFNVAESTVENKPILLLDTENNLHVFFAQASSLYQAISTDQGETFTIETFSEEAGGFYAATLIEDELEVLYSQDIHTNLAYYQLFNDIEASVNADGGISAGMVKYWGQDVIYGPVHSNDDIWLQNAGGGDNNGWPTFYGKVTTSGNFLIYPSGESLVGAAYPPDVLDNIFQGGYVENAPEIYHENSIDLIETNGIHLLPTNADLAVIELNGSTYSGYYGEIVEIGTQEFPVYSWYPSDAQQVNEIIAEGGNWFEDSELIYTNQMTLYDTIWTAISGSANDEAFWVDGDLYISGEVSGMQVWGCSGNAYLLGDISYSNTVLGEHPDGFLGINANGEPEYDENAVNETDFFALASDSQIKIAYKFRLENEGETTMYDNNAEGIILYGFFLAPHDADEEEYGEYASHYDGVFTFDYQHPHGSTPNFVAPSPYSGADTLYSYVDLHKYIFPPDPLIADELQIFNLQSNGVMGNGNHFAYPYQLVGFPYDSSQNPGPYANSYPNFSPDYVEPDGTDWPWYNPVWPESAETISNNLWYSGRNATLYGSIIQRRRGYMRRSGSDPYNHPSPPTTNPEEFHYGGTHPPTGFSKNYFYDARLATAQFPNITNNLVIKNFFYATSQDQGASFSSQPLETYNHNNLDNLRKVTDQSQLYYLLQTAYEDGFSTALLQKNAQAQFDVIFESIELGYISALQKIGAELFLLERETDDAGNLQFNLISWQPETDFQQILTLPANTLAANSLLIDTNLVILFADSDNQLNIYYDFESSQFTSQYSWQAPFEHNLQQIALQFAQDKIHLLAQEAETAATYYLQGDWNGILPTGDQPAPQLTYRLENYPNPFNPTTTISFQANEAENVAIEIYNIKGQLVRNIAIENQPYQINQVVWNGKDQSGKAVGSGVYMYRLLADDKNVLSNKMLLMK